jgi:hypothetical protein
MRTNSSSRSGSLTSVNGRMGSTQIIKGDWSGLERGPRPIKAVLLGLIVGSRKGYSQPWPPHNGIPD